MTASEAISNAVTEAEQTTTLWIYRRAALANIVQRFGSRVREALMTASEAISNAVTEAEQTTTTPAESMSRFVKEMNDKGMNVYCIDETRVPLKIGASASGDYIHANYVVFPELQNKFICTQVFIYFNLLDFGLTDIYLALLDVYCIDETRVPLKIGASASGDYIHANYVVFPELQNKFICTQVFIYFNLLDFGLTDIYLALLGFGL
uniref:CN hydrolase domain-containing protein n=1 Tax=Ascaris lumbricoides TaxID=6252 RepID=A0A0M3IQM1_ASCLU